LRNGTKRTVSIKKGGARPGAGRPREKFTVQEIVETLDKNALKDLRKSELYEIIELCQAKSVSKLKISGIELEFFQTEGSKVPTNIKDEVSLSDKETFSELRLTQELIDDPMSFEQHMIDAHMNRGTDA